MDVTVTHKISRSGADDASFTEVISVEGFSKIVFTLEGGAADQEVQVCPGEDSYVKYVSIQADAYEEKVEGTPDVSYKPHVAESVAISLGTPHVWFPDQDAAAEADFDLLFFSNGGDDARSITIYVGRDVLVPLV